jgi:ATP-binding cassette subfamily B protein
VSANGSAGVGLANGRGPGPAPAGAASSGAPKLPPTAAFIWRLSTYHPLPQVVSGLCWVAFHSWPLFPGLLARAFFDALTGAAPAGPTPATIVAVMVALALARAGFVFGDLQVGTLAGFRSRGLLQRNLLARILARPGAQALPVSSGEALSTFRDDVDTMWGAGWVFDVVGFAVFAAGGLAILLSVDQRVTLLVFLPIVAVILLAHVARARLRRLRERSRAATARVTGALGEVFGAVQAIQVAGAEARVTDHLRRLGDTRRRAMLGDRLLELGLDAAFANTASLGAGLTLLVAASAMRAGTFSVGDFALFATYLMQVAEMTGFLGWIVSTYQQMGVSFRRGVALLQGAPPLTLVAHHPVPLRPGEAGPRPPAAAPAPVAGGTGDDRLRRLEVVGLTSRHPGSGRGIEGVSFSVEPGSLIAVTGRVGAGKTTLLRAVLGLVESQAGEVRWNGRPLRDRGGFLVPPRVAYTPQVPALLSGTVRENLLLGLRAAPDDLHRAVWRAALDRDLAALPDGLDTVVGARGVRLSGGQALRAALARMYVRRASLLVLDDVSSALDVETERLLWERLDALLREEGVACLVATHRPAVLRRAARVLVLEEGRVAGEAGS